MCGHESIYAALVAVDATIEATTREAASLDNLRSLVEPLDASNLIPGLVVRVYGVVGLPGTGRLEHLLFHARGPSNGSFLESRRALYRVEIGRLRRAVPCHQQSLKNQIE